MFKFSGDLFTIFYHISKANASILQKFPFKISLFFLIFSYRHKKRKKKDEMCRKIQKTASLSRAK